jgi:ABC-type amino acid transport substrate-binding protein
MSKKLPVTAVLLAAVLVSAGAQQTIRIGYWDNAPYVMGQPGGRPPQGAAVDYWTTIVAPAMNVKIDWQGPTPLLRLMTQIQAGDIDAILIVARNPDREKVMSFPAAPFVKFQPGLAVARDAALGAVKSADDIAGLRIGYADGAAVPDFMKNAKVTWDNLSTATWVADSFAKLANKRIDAVFNLTTVGLQYAAEQGFTDRFKFLALPIAASDIYTTFAKTDKGAAFLKAYDAVNAKNASATDGLVQKYTK